MSQVTEAGKQDEQAGRNRLRWWMWGLFLLGCGTLAAIRAERNARFYADQEAYTAWFQETNEQLQRRWREITATFRRWPTQQVLETQLNGGQPLQLKPVGNGDYATDWEDPVSRYRWKLKFWRGKLAGWTSFDEPNRILQQHPPVERADYEGYSEAFRRWLLGWVPWLWIGLWPLVLLLRRHRLPLAELLLATAILSAIAWAVHPAYTLAVSGILSNDQLFWGALMLATSTAAVAACARRRRNPWQFSLRTMLGVMTALAILLGLSPVLCMVVVLDTLLGLAVYWVLHGTGSQGDDLPESGLGLNQQPSSEHGQPTTG